MFILKKIVSSLFLPVPVCLALLIAGLIMLWFTRRQKGGKIVTSLGVALLFLFSFGPVGDLFLAPLEGQYQPLFLTPATEAAVRDATPPVKWIVVLGGGHTSDPQIPVTSQIEHVALARLVEAIRLHRALPESKLILSGGIGFDPVTQAEVLSKVAQALGVSEASIVLENVAKDTEEEARIIRSMVGGDKFILVTSAAHMPRSMALFVKQGMNPIPAPADYWIKQSQATSPTDLFPGSGALRKIENAAHEYIGLAWSKLRGKI